MGNDRREPTLVGRIQGKGARYGFRKSSERPGRLHVQVKRVREQLGCNEAKPETGGGARDASNRSRIGPTHASASGTRTISADSAIWLPARVEARPRSNCAGSPVTG